ncbi:MAG: aldo/keto reductase, partial [Phenylobacterium sp.]|nr:aldo/keto reductase [Phenylobacterium sp.]
MERRAYCRTGPDVGVLTYGAMTIAADPGLRDGVAPSLLAALEAGVNLVDTARVYPGSEEIVAATLKAWRGPAPLVSTKVRSRARDAYRFACPVAEAHPPEGVRESVEASLKALGRYALRIVHVAQRPYAGRLGRSWLEALLA